MYSSDSKITLILAAAGIGKRMGLGYPKQFIEVDGEPLYLKSLKIAEKCNIIDKVIIVTGKESICSIENKCKENNFKKIHGVIEGGSERQYSINNALIKCQENTLIAVQDGVRPFLKERYFFEAISILKDEKIDGVVVGVPLKDTIKKVNKKGEVIITPDRKEYIAAHTPQIFRGKILKKAYKSAMEDNFLGTDDSSLVERIGGKVKILIGDYDNIKITTKEDLSCFKEEK